MLQAKHQSFNDGSVKIYSLGNIALPGDMSKEELALLQTLRYHERTVGFNRFYVAKQSDIKVAFVIRCPRIKTLSDNLVAIMNDGQQYEVIQIQYPEDVEPPVMDLTLERLGVDYDIS